MLKSHPFRLLTVALVLAFVIVPVASAAGSSSGASGTPIAAAPGSVVHFGGIGVTVPAAGQEVTAVATTFTGSVTLQVQTASDGSVSETTSDPAYSGSGVTPDTGECSDSYEPTDLGYKWTSTFKWYFHSNSTPSSNTVANVETDLKAAAGHVTGEHNNCGRSDTVSATQSYGGRLQQSTNIDNSGDCLPGDGTNMAGFGILPEGTIALTCTYSSSGVANESDMRLNSSPNWITDEGSGCQTAYNVDNLATHERGHTFGMADVYNSDHSELTMYGYADPCTTLKETLALGDMLRLEAKY